MAAKKKLEKDLAALPPEDRLGIILAAVREMPPEQKEAVGAAITGQILDALGPMAGFGKRIYDAAAGRTFDIHKYGKLTGMACGVVTRYDENGELHMLFTGKAPQEKAAKQAGVAYDEGWFWPAGAMRPHEPNTTAEERKGRNDYDHDLLAAALRVVRNSAGLDINPKNGTVNGERQKIHIAPPLEITSNAVEKNESKKPLQMPHERSHGVRVSYAIHLGRGKLPELKPEAGAERAAWFPVAKIECRDKGKKNEHFVYNDEKGEKHILTPGFGRAHVQPTLGLRELRDREIKEASGGSIAGQEQLYKFTNRRSPKIDWNPYTAETTPAMAKNPEYEFGKKAYERHQKDLQAAETLGLLIKNMLPHFEAVIRISRGERGK